MGRRTIERPSDGAGPKKIQPPRVRRPAGAECRIRRLRRATGSDAGNLSAPAGNRQGTCRADCCKLREFLRNSAEGNVRSLAYAPGVEDIFGPGGALARALPDYEPRREQAALAGAVEHALATGEHLVAEAGTGVGESLAYLVPALASGQRVVVATATKALQEQLLSKDVPIAAAAVGRRVEVEVLKGRANY